MEIKNYNAKAEVEGRTIIGYAAVFDNVDQVKDVIQRGAFKKTLKERKPKVFYNHMHPIGTPTEVTEDHKGLYTESKISNTPRGDEILELVKDGAISEMSIAFQTIKCADDHTSGVRTLKELKLYEYGPVDFAANEEAVISGVKHLTERIRERRDISGSSLAQIRSILDEMKAIIEHRAPEGTPAEEEPTSEVTQLETWVKSLGPLVHEFAEAIRTKE